MRTARAVHPFPARMAPEVALAAVGRLPHLGRVLDPMCGSGVVLREAAERGHDAIGLDLDPLAVLMSRVWNRPLNTDRLRASVERLLNEAERADPKAIRLPWIDDDEETSKFVDFWFAPEQRSRLRVLADGLGRRRGAISDALKLAISKIVITKHRGASLAWDVSHSRPHRMRTSNTYDVFNGFRRAVDQIAATIDSDKPMGRVLVHQGDARWPRPSFHGRFDAVITSPAYLTAIDYMRGHRLSLVWLGYRVAELRAIRSRAVGTERGGAKWMSERQLAVNLEAFGDMSRLEIRWKRMLYRYVRDIQRQAAQTSRCLKVGGFATYVIGNSRIHGIEINNAQIISQACRLAGLRETGRLTRKIPGQHRYLPPPSPTDTGPLGQRMKSEVVLHFEKDKA